MNKIRNLIKAEIIKNRHTFIALSLWLLPLITTILATFLLAGKQLQQAVFNWWYMVMLPAEVALISVYLLESDEQQNYFNLKLTPIPTLKICLAKILTGCCYLLFTNLIMMLLVLLVGRLFGKQLMFGQVFLATILLTVSFAWQIPLGMLLELKLPAVFTLIVMVTVNVFFASQTFAGNKILWLIPFAIPARLMAAILGVNPNGVVLAKNSFLHTKNVILPGVLLTITLFGICVLVLNYYFKEDRL
ncbi:lantibiotic immunity ABC transporter MutE/EpiE family permease subunit [Lactobacillus sp. ESL0785]|uniref:lantibiotic immunity ABC transporter MutE/EpiE family permease subunit n=1 Tax=Lactobacillus sp. ESL0785 TaxID=2983232 RepID=UPI0023F95F88|nr:lantibiotic immunity ABC transporter MutE/EpiE family permease subunit [Lactobacillus sp. ESL0785]WEV71356.1 lantibiotic immunity ABC transporter MutE/EpiE family permease subunit [Lactobacillus sp. ESL0785]